MSIADDIKTVLEFYKALGFEKLPLTAPTINRHKNIKAERCPGSGGSPEATDTRNPCTRPLVRPDADKKGSSFAAGSSCPQKASLDGLRSEIDNCTRCKLHKGRSNIVFGEGNPGAALMFIGEAPGREEDIQARPFVGDAGKLLTSLIEKMGLRRDEVYIGNILKCRPPLNRDPEDDEIEMCLPFIERQIEIISPRIIVSLGRISAHTLTGTKIPITRLRGRFHEYKGIPLMPTFHPAYLLRNPRDKWLVWEDAQRVIERLEKGA